MERRPTTQDLTWLIDLRRNNQLDTDPPYQRRSVWTRSDKQYFLDTIFRNYPSPAIFLHKTIADTGRSTYHVVDGKQRTQTILDFVEDRLRLSGTFGDARLDGKLWSQLQGETELKRTFWNYQITVEMIDVTDGSVVNEVFDRLNRNARKLTRQELRHAKYDGWLITEAESESQRDEWTALGVATRARARRMVDVQFISELMLIVLEGCVVGFDQDHLDAMYAKYDIPAETGTEDAVARFPEQFAAARSYLWDMNAADPRVCAHAKGFGNFYSLFALVALLQDRPPADDMAARYVAFIGLVDELSRQEDLDAFLRLDSDGRYSLPYKYLSNSLGASTDPGPRRERLDVLRDACGVR